jgi:predicted phosphodiesterase
MSTGASTSGRGAFESSLAPEGRSMAKFIFWSDLHLNFNRAFKIPPMPSDVDAILIAGDISDKGEHIGFLERVNRETGLPVIAVWGNHDAYFRSYFDLYDEEARFLDRKQKQGRRIHVLHGEAVEVAGVRIVGAPLWTDFSLYAAPMDGPPDPDLVGRKTQEAMDLAARSMSDFRLIWKGRGDGGLMTPQDTVDLHVAQKWAIFDILDQRFEGPTIVMTHHMPARQCIAPIYAGDKLTPAFANDLLPEIDERRVDAWIYGHSHENLEFDHIGRHGLTRFRSNPLGYPHERTRFDALRTIEV